MNNKKVDRKILERCAKCYWFDKCPLWQKKDVKDDIHRCKDYTPLDELEIAVEEYEEDLTMRDEIYQSIIDEQNG